MAEVSGRRNGNHSISIEQRNKISITGVIDVLSFDEEGIIADTEMGIIILKGKELHVGKLNVDDGGLFVEGEVDSIEYTDEGNNLKTKNSLLGRLFR